MSRKKEYLLMKQITSMENMIQAFRKVRANGGVAGVDMIGIQRYEQNLQSNLEDLAQRILEERYYPMPIRKVQIAKPSGGKRPLGILTIEDRIAQRAVKNILEPIFEEEFLDCSYGYRPQKAVEHAIAKILAYQSEGYKWVVDADIKECYERIDHKLLIDFISRKVEDRAVLRLIQMWLDVGIMGKPQADSSEISKSLTLLDRTADFMAEAADRAIGYLLQNEGPYGYQASFYNETGFSSPPHPLYPSERDEGNELHKQAKKEAFMRLGRDGLLLLLTSYKGIRRILTVKSLMIAGPIFLTLAAIPAVSKMVSKRWNHSLGIIQGGPISPLLSNIYLHQFDKVMIRQGFKLVRFADDFVLLAPNEQRAKEALAAAEKRLSELRLELNPQKTRLVRCEDEFQFLGYVFDETGCRGPLPGQNAVARLEHLKKILSEGIHYASEKSIPMLKIGKQHVTNLTSKISRKIHNRHKDVSSEEE